MLFDVNHRQIAQYESSDKLLSGAVVFFGIGEYRQSGRNPLVSAPGVTHNRNRSAGHTHIAGAGGSGYHAAVDVVAEKFFCPSRR